MTDDKHKIVKSPDEVRTFSTGREYWTEERMAKATPLNLPEIERHPEIPMNALLDEREEEFFEGSVPRNANVLNRLRDLNGKTFITEEVADMTVFPFLAVGKLFMTFGEQDFVGSAWIIGDSAIFTAGHCVFDRDNGGWARNVTLKVGFKNGTYNKCYAIKSSFALEDWVNRRDFTADMAMCVTTSLIDEKHGRLGAIAHSSEREGVCVSIGYPAARPFNGQTMQQSTGNFQTISGLLEMKNNMTGGCSGGPIVTKQNGKFYAIGLNSHGIIGVPDKMFSPLFEDRFISLFKKGVETRVGEEVLTTV